MKKPCLKRILSLVVVAAMLSFALTAFAAGNTYTVTFSTGQTASVSAGEDLVFAIVCNPPTDIKGITSSAGKLTVGEFTLGGPSKPQGIINGIWTLSNITSDVTITLTLNSQEGAALPELYIGKDAAEAAIEKSASGSMGSPPGQSAEKLPSTTLSASVNGIPLSFIVYTIDGSYYYKLRDIAQAVASTEREFEVGWDNEKGSITLATGYHYTQTGEEFTEAQPGSTISKLTSRVLLNGKEVSLSGYSIGGYSYFKILDIAKLIDFGARWDSATNTLKIDTVLGYAYSFYK